MRVFLLVCMLLGATQQASYVDKGNNKGNIVDLKSNLNLNIPEHPLFLDDSKEVLGIENQPIMLPIKCTWDDSTLVRFVGLNGLPGEVLRISNNGISVKRFGLDQKDEFKDAFIYDFTTSEDGKLHFLIQTSRKSKYPSKYFILLYSSDGVYLNHQALENENFFARKIGVFGDGNYLISGFTKGMNSQSITYIYNPRGQLVKEISMTQDLKDESDQDPSKRKITAQQNAEVTAKALKEVLFSSMGLLDTGEIALIRSSPKGPLYLINSGGTARKIDLQLPENADFITMRTGHGMVLIFFSQTLNQYSQKYTYELIDPQTGAVKEILHANDSKMGVAVGCIGPNHIDFIGAGTKNTTLNIHHASWSH